MPFSDNRKDQTVKANQAQYVTKKVMEAPMNEITNPHPNA